MSVKSSTNSHLNRHLLHLVVSGGGIIVAIILILIFQKIASNINNPRVAYIDETVVELTRFIASPTTDFVFKIISFFGSEFFIIPATIIYSIYLYKKKHHHRTILILVFAVLGSFVINSFLKGIFLRDRPINVDYAFLWFDYSFPSGHAMVATTFYGLIAYISAAKNKNISMRVLTAIFFGIIIALIGLSRIMLGVHYFSDVIAAFSVGGFWLIWNVYTLKLIYKND